MSEKILTLPKEEAGFIYHSRVTIWKNPVTEMQRTKALGLLHKQVKKDASMSRVGIPDYLMVFRKDGEHKHPVKCGIDVDTWQKYASPVWMDIDYSNTLNAVAGREGGDENGAGGAAAARRGDRHGEAPHDGECAKDLGVAHGKLPLTVFMYSIRQCWNPSRRVHLCR